MISSVEWEAWEAENHCKCMHFQQLFMISSVELGKAECCVADAQHNRNESNAHQYSLRNNNVAYINNEFCTNHIFCEFVWNRDNCAQHITQDPQGRDPICIRMCTTANNSLNEALDVVTITVFANLNGNKKQCFTDAQPLKRIQNTSMFLQK